MQNSLESFLINGRWIFLGLTLAFMLAGLIHIIPVLHLVIKETAGTSLPGRLAMTKAILNQCINKLFLKWMLGLMVISFILFGISAAL